MFLENFFSGEAMTLASSSIDSGTKALISSVSLLGPNKSNSTYEHVNTLKNCTINNLLELLKISDLMKILILKYTTLFTYYFNKNKPLNEMILFEKKLFCLQRQNRFMI